jgi:hypothetical protein
VTVDIVITRDRSSGRYHKRYYDSDSGGFTSYDELIDQSGPFDVVTASALELAEPDDLCHRCFPPDHQDGQTG